MPLSDKSRSVIDEFGRSQGVTPEQYESLKGLIESSPLLAEKFDQVVAKGGLRIVLRSGPQVKSGYSGSDRKLHLDPRMLSMTTDRSNHFKRIGYLGYQMQRAFDHDGQAAKLNLIRDKARRIARSGVSEWPGQRGSKFDRFRKRVERIIRPGSRERNYTGVLRKYLDAQRRYQAAAEIARWNAMVSAMHKAAGNPPVKPVEPGSRHSRWYRHFKLGSDVLPPDFAYSGMVVRDHQHYLAASEKNIRAVAQNVAAGDHAVNGAFTNRGHLGNSLRARYPAGLVGYIAQLEHDRYPASGDGASAPAVRIDAKALGLSAETIANHAARHGCNAEAVARLRYVDRSDGMPVCGTFAPPISKLDQPGHPDHNLYLQTLSKVRGLPGSLSALACSNIAAALLVKASGKCIRIDEVRMRGSEIVAVQSQSDNRRMAIMITEMSELQTVPFETSCMRWNADARNLRQAALQESPSLPPRIHDQASAPSMQEIKRNHQTKQQALPQHVQTLQQDTQEQRKELLQQLKMGHALQLGLHANVQVELRHRLQQQAHQHHKLQLQQGVREQEMRERQMKEQQQALQKLQMLQRQVQAVQEQLPEQALEQQFQALQQRLEGLRGRQPGQQRNLRSVPPSQPAWRR